MTLLTFKKKFTIMVKKIYDVENQRTIVLDSELDSLTIVGDYSSSSITSYWVVNRFNLDKPFGVYIIKSGALRRCKYLNSIYKTDTYIVIERTIFVC